MNKIFRHFLDRSLSHVVRFNSTPQQFGESVAEHSFYVAYFTSILIYFLREAGEEVDEARALKIALLHDAEEKFSGDILTPFKHYNEDVLRAIRKVNQETISFVFEDLPPDLSAEFIALWNEDVNLTTKEAQIVKTADKVSLLAKCYEEIKIGNEFFLPIYERELGRLSALSWPWWRKIKKHILPHRRTPIPLPVDHLH
ncbi:MAG: 5'-nucleotidase [Parcubacteria group bacterium Gr01-1014_29]|nr:MAG: 5'-nucleotidase [Parcubacteria group bacterium Gr01-1014_29]